MMKKIALIAALLGINISAFADIAVNWSAGAGFYNWNWNDVGSAGGAALDNGDYINFGGGSATAYLIFSTDGVVDLDLGNLAGGLVSGNDSVVDTFSVVNSPFGDYDAGPRGPASPPNYALYTGNNVATIFLRIIDTSAPGVGILYQYYDTAPVIANIYNPAQPASQVLQHNATDPINGNQLIAVVPEPSVLAFLGIGGLALAIRRRLVA